MAISFYDVKIKPQHEVMLDLLKRICAADKRNDGHALSEHIESAGEFLQVIGHEVDETYDLRKR